MLKIEDNWETVGWRHAIRGMRNPMNSWEWSDSYFNDGEGNFFNILGGKLPPWPEPYTDILIGPNDHDLMMNLRNAGTDHRKFMRMITVYMDLTAPLYWWKEFDTYKVGTVTNSCSTMHKIHEKEFTLDDFSCEHLLSLMSKGDERTVPIIDVSLYHDKEIIYSPNGWLTGTIYLLNECRKCYLETNDKKYWWQMIQLLPSSYNQKRTVMLNYEVLANIYKSRRNHKLDEWHALCDWIERLPYSELITGGIDNENSEME